MGQTVTNILIMRMREEWQIWTWKNLKSLMLITNLCQMFTILQEDILPVHIPLDNTSLNTFTSKTSREIFTNGKIQWEDHLVLGIISILVNLEETQVISI